MTVHNSPLLRLRQIFSMILISLLIVFGSPLAVWAEETPTTTDQTTTTTTAATTSDPATTTTPPTTDPASATSSTDPAPSPGTADNSTATTTTTDPSTTTTGPTSPTGADSTTYTYNPSTGLWENDMYTWDPVTKQTAPKQPQTYSYNPTTGQWDTTEWVYDAPSGKYVPNVTSVSTPPADATLDTSAGAPLKNSSDTSSPKSLSTLASPTNNSLAPAQTPKSSGLFDLFYNASISNTLTSLAQSGDATVALNTLAGSALSGSATAIATIVNLLQSSWNLLAGNFSTFTQNLFGNVLGDLTLSPTTPTSSPPAIPDNLTVNSDQNTAINNKITLDADSGNATVSQNTQAGSATSGDATAIANLINAINSSISAGQSFIGMLNIFGNLDGDILIPPELTQTLIAANAIGTLDTSQIENSSLLGTFTNNQSTTNNVSLDASSGTATVSNNTAAGSATTGDAQTNLTVLNLTGRQVIGKDALLVFVNVLGRWVGMIVNAPNGSTSAALGGGITDNSNLVMNTNGNQAITNDISVGAHSGNALVDGNTSAGNATSGDAKAAVNLANINGSQFSLSNWFGILFINVFGTWRGSFGIDTVAGTIPTIPTQSNSTASTSMPAISAVHAYRFVPTATGKYSLDNVEVSPEVLAAVSTDNSSSSKPYPSSNINSHIDPPLIPKSQDWTLSLLGVAIAGSLLGTERLLSRRSRMTAR